MKITFTNYKGDTEDCTLSDALKMMMDACYGNGQIENLQGRVDNILLVLATVTTVLADKGLLSAADVRSMLPDDYTVED